MTAANRQFLLQTLFDFRLYFCEKSISLTHLSLVSKTSSCDREQQILFLINPNDLRINSNDLRMTSMFLVNIQLEKVTDTETL